MSTEVLHKNRDRVLLVGDAFLFTTAASAAALGLLLGLFELAGSPGSSAFWGLTNTALMLAGLVVGVFAAWRLHDHMVTRTAVIGGIIGAAAGGVAVPIIGFIAYLFGLIAGLFTTWELAGLVIAAVVFGSAFVALVAWLLVDAARDLAPSRRSHIRIDIARLVASAVILIFSAAVIFAATQNPGGEIAEAIIFALLAGLAGAFAVAGADFAISTVARRQGTPPVGV